MWRRSDCTLSFFLHGWASNPISAKESNIDWWIRSFVPQLSLFTQISIKWMNLSVAHSILLFHGHTSIFCLGKVTDNSFLWSRTALNTKVLSLIAGEIQHDKQQTLGFSLPQLPPSTTWLCHCETKCRAPACFTEVCHSISPRICKWDDEHEPTL